MIPVFNPVITNNDIKSVLLSLRRKEISGNFSHSIIDLEERFANYCGSRFGVAVSSGTTALHLAVASLNINAGSEILVSATTNIATALACYHNNCKPIAVDSRLDTWNIDEDEISKYITKKTRAIIVVHFLGNPVNMDKVLKIANKYNLYVIEDAAEAHGSTFNNKKVGSFGDIGCFSFYANKTITSGEGGILTTNNKKIAEKLKLMRNLGFTKKRFVHYIAGYNFRLTGYQAALALSQLKRIDSIIKKKIAIANLYKKYLKDFDGVRLQESLKNSVNTFWMVGILNLYKKNNKIILSKKLRSCGIETRSFFLSIRKQPCFKKIYNKKDYLTPNSNYLWDNGLYLPSSINLTEAKIFYICKKIKSAY
jgi:perosamine synthetase